MCTVTLVLPQSYPGISQHIQLLTDLKEPRKDSCYLDDFSLVWHAGGWYYNFSWQRRKLILNSVSDYNPLPGYRPLPLATALSVLAMDQVDNLEVQQYEYRIKTDSGNRLRRVLSDNLGTRFLLSKWAVKNYFGPLPLRHISAHYRKLLAMAEEAILSPSQIVLITSQDDEEASLEPNPNKTILIIDRHQNIFKCRLSKTRLRLTNAAPSGNFRIHNYRNSHIRITGHCLERFASRVLEIDLAKTRPGLTEANLLTFIKNQSVGISCLMGRTAFVNVAGKIFIGAVARGVLTMITVYPETTLNINAFHDQAADLLEQNVQAYDA